MRYRTLQPGSSISLQLAGDQGAALLTKHLTYREDIQREWTFEEYTREHYDSWVVFARERGHGNDIKPVLVTGVDRTKDFAMVAYSNDDDDLTTEFTISDPGVTSPWGTWRTSGVVSTNCGPLICRPPSSTEVGGTTSSANSHAGAASDEYNQCVFVRYSTVRKRLGIPRVIKAAAGPHDLGPGSRDGEQSLLEIQRDSDSGLDTVSSSFDYGRDDGGSSVTSLDSESDVVIHNTTPVRSLLRLVASFARSDCPPIGRKGRF